MRRTSSSSCVSPSWSSLLSRPTRRRRLSCPGVVANLDRTLGAFKVSLIDIRRGVCRTAIILAKRRSSPSSRPLRGGLFPVSLPSLVPTCPGCLSRNKATRVWTLSFKNYAQYAAFLAAAKTSDSKFLKAKVLYSDPVAYLDISAEAKLDTIETTIFGNKVYSKADIRFRRDLELVFLPWWLQAGPLRAGCAGCQ